MGQQPAITLYVKIATGNGPFLVDLPYKTWRFSVFTGEYPRGKNQERALKIAGHFFHGDRSPGINRDCVHISSLGFFLEAIFRNLI